MRTRDRLRIGRLWVDVISLAEALDGVRDLVRRGEGGYVFTPNVDHVVGVEENVGLRRAYRGANLSLADGMPLVWSSPLLGRRLPAKLSGSDLLMPIARLAAAEGWRVYVLGGLPGAAVEAAARLHELCGLRVVGIDDAMVSMDGGTPGDADVVARVRMARPDLVFVALGTPKQELWIARTIDELRPAVAIGVGASVDFVAGRVKRAPSWVSSAGLEWAFRLAQDPRRLWRRYLVRGPRFLGIVARTARLRPGQRVRAARLPAAVQPQLHRQTELQGTGTPCRTG